MTHATHPFDDALALDPGAPDHFSGRTTPGYWNMVGPYGGITAATLLQAVL
ncbi:MAG TPA: thioesterase family protein, partial [Alicycliphilus sp.]|nr:thioesterase family protein [Alicycliphilus sp.]